MQLLTRVFTLEIQRELWLKIYRKKISRPKTSFLVRTASDPQLGLSGVVASDELKRQSVRGGAASVMSRGTGLVLQIGTTLILARLLSPADYGLQAMVLTLVNLCSLFQDAGLSAVTIQRETMTQEQISTLFWLNAGLGVFLTGLVAAALACSWLSSIRTLGCFG